MEIELIDDIQPIFPHGERVALVERMDIPGALGVAKRGGKVVCPLPIGYDMHTSVTYHKGYVLVAHPGMPPLQCDTTTGEVKKIDPAHIAAQPGKFKLLTR